MSHTTKHIKQLRKEIALELHALRVYSGVSQEVVCRKFLLSNKRLDDIEIGRGKYRLSLLVRMADFYGKKVKIRFE